MELEENFELDMKDYCSKGRYKKPKPNICGTSFCFAGYLAALDGYPANFISPDGRFLYNLYSSELIVYTSEDLEWDFLFGSYWTNTFKSLKERCAYVLEHNTFPDNFDWGYCEGYDTSNMPTPKSS